MPGDWACHICGSPDNRDWRKKCRRCEAYRNEDMESKLGYRPASLAERQVQMQRNSSQQQLQQKRKDEAERRKLREEVEKLRELVAAKSSQQASADCGDGDDAGDEMDESGAFATWSEDERAKRLELAKGGLAYAAACHGDESDQAAKFREEIAALQRASREAKPFKAHRDQLERRRERLRRQQERDEEAIAKAQAEIAELQGKVEGLQATVAERARTIAEVTDELNELVRKALAEGADGEPKKPPWAQESSPWSAMSAAIRGLAEQPGILAEFVALLTHVQQAATALSSAAAAQAQPAAASPPAASGTAPWAATPADGKAKTATPVTPIVLAPHGKPGKAAPKATPPPPLPKPPPPPSGEGQGNGTRREGEGGIPCGNATAADDAVDAGAAAANEAHNDSDPEMLEEGSKDDVTMSTEIEKSLALLPELDQRRLRAAIRLGGGRGREEDGEEDADGSRRRERERSPRPTKNSDKEL